MTLDEQLAAAAAPAPEAWKAADIARLVAEHNALLEESYRWRREHNDRRERIATAVFAQAFSAGWSCPHDTVVALAGEAVRNADILIAALDAK